MKRKLQVLVIAFVLCFTQVVVAQAATVKTFDRDATIAFCDAEWQNDLKDCVKFTRAALEAGGVPCDTSRTYGYTPEQYSSYLLDNGYATKYELQWTPYRAGNGNTYVYVGIEENSEVPIQPGDALLYECTNEGCDKPLFHMAIVSSNDRETDPGKAETYANFWWLYQNNKSINAKIYRYAHSRCGGDAEEVKLYLLHISDEFKAPLKQAAITSVAKSSTKVKVTWKKVSGADGYEISRSTSSKKFNKVLTIKSGTKTYGTVSATKGKKYYYRVRAYRLNDAGEKIYGLESKYKTYTRY